MSSLTHRWSKCFIQRGLTCKYSQTPSRKCTCTCAKWAGGTLEPLGGEPPRPSSCPSARVQQRWCCVASTADCSVAPEDRNVGLCLFLFLWNIRICECRQPIQFLEKHCKGQILKSIHEVSSTCKRSECKLLVKSRTSSYSILSLIGLMPSCLLLPWPCEAVESKHQYQNEN